VSALGSIHRHVRPSQEILQTITVTGVAGDPDAPAHVEGLTTGCQGLVEDAQQAFRQGEPGLVIGLGEQQGEFVAAEPGEEVPTPQRAAQPGANFMQQQVAHLMAKRVVDLLEAVQVQQQQRERVRIPRRQQRLETLHQRGPVWQARQQVVVRLVAELLGFALAGRDVRERHLRDDAGEEDEGDPGRTEEPQDRDEATNPGHRELRWHREAGVIVQTLLDGDAARDRDDR
jgi:hypothetical protein